MASFATLLNRIRTALRSEPAMANPELADASGAPAGGEPRSAYKAVWNRLAETEEQARFSIGGFTDEAAYVYTGEASMAVLQRTVGIGAEDRVLEIGCGVARVGFVIAPHCAEWTGCDVSANMLTHAARRLSSRDNGRLVEISGFDLAPIANASMDVVYCTVVFMHLDEWDRYNYLREAHRVLSPGGRVYVDNFSLATDEGWSVFEECLNYSPQARPSHISRSSTPQEISVFLARAGFEAIQIEEDGAWVRGWARKPAAGSAA